MSDRQPDAALKRFIDTVEKLAFEMPPMNEYTPRFVQLCIEARNVARPSAPSRDAVLEEAAVAMDTLFKHDYGATIPGQVIRVLKGTAAQGGVPPIGASSEPDAALTAAAAPSAPANAGPRTEQGSGEKSMPPLTVDQALSLVEQERLDELAAREPGDPDHYECAAYVLASEVRKMRLAQQPSALTTGATPRTVYRWSHDGNTMEVAVNGSYVLYNDYRQLERERNDARSKLAKPSPYDFEVGGPPTTSGTLMADEEVMSDQRKRIDQLERELAEKVANEQAYERILGPKSYNEVACELAEANSVWLGFANRDLDSSAVARERIVVLETQAAELRRVLAVESSWVKHWQDMALAEAQKVQDARFAAPQSAVGAQWIPVSERLPRRKVRVLWYMPDGAIIVESAEDPMLSICTTRAGAATHWMPLPAAPTDDTGSKTTP